MGDLINSWSTTFLSSCFELNLSFIFYDRSTSEIPPAIWYSKPMFFTVYRLLNYVPYIYTFHFSRFLPVWLGGRAENMVLGTLPCPSPTSLSFFLLSQLPFNQIFYFSSLAKPCFTPCCTSMSAVLMAFQLWPVVFQVYPIVCHIQHTGITWNVPTGVKIN